MLLYIILVGVKDAPGIAKVGCLSIWEVTSNGVGSIVKEKLFNTCMLVEKSNVDE